MSNLIFQYDDDELISSIKKKYIRYRLIHLAYLIRYMALLLSIDKYLVSFNLSRHRFINY